MSIPVAFDLASAMSASKSNIAWGENNICPKIYKTLQSILANLYLPPVYKTWMRIEPPLQWKGGILCELYKNKGLSTDVNNYRDIMLGDISGKFITKHIRKSLLSVAISFSRATQFGGGFNGGETSFAHLYIRLIIDICKVHNSSSSVLFIDVVAAFASLMRHVVFYNPNTDEEWAKALSNVGFAQQDISLIFNCILAAPWDHTADNSSSFLIAHEAYCNTWFTQDGLAGVVATQRGSNAGMPLADLIFSLAMSRILSTFYNTIKKEGLTSVVPGQNNLPVIEVSFVDDVAIPVVSTACNIVQKTASTAAIAYKIFLMYGLKLNFAKGKSEAIIAFRGYRCKQLHTDLIASGNSTPLPGCPCKLSFVQCYKHMGTQTPCSANMAAEVTTRAAYMNSDIKYITFKYFSLKNLNIKNKLTIATTYMLTRGTLQCSTWGLLTDHVFNKFHTAILNVYRAATNNRFNKAKKAESTYISDQDLILNFSLISPINILNNCRLQLLMRLFKKAPACLLDLQLVSFSQDTCWRQAINQALDWLSTSPKYNTYKNAPLEVWIDLFKQNLSSHANAIAKYAHSPFGNLYKLSISSTLPEVHTHFCPLCQYSCSSSQMLSVHSYSFHKIGCSMRNFIDGVTCTICLKHFHTRENLLNHSKKSKLCYSNLLARGPILDDNEAAVLDDDERARNRKLYKNAKKRHARDHPTIQAFGPWNKLLVAPTRPSNHHPLGWGYQYSPIAQFGIPNYPPNPS